MIAIVSSRQDEGAQALVARWSGWNAALLDADDLVRPGWRVRTGEPASWTLVVSGEVVPARSLTGVLVRRPFVLEREFPGTKAADRSYVAAETNALLVALLARLECPVLNRPVAASLGGPCWRPEQWTQVAARLGIPFAPVNRLVRSGLEPRLDLATEGELVTITVVGDVCVEDAGEMGAQAVKLARSVGAELLSAFFRRGNEGVRFLTASPFPDLREPGVSDAVLERLRGDA